MKTSLLWVSLGILLGGVTFQCSTTWPVPAPPGPAAPDAGPALNPGEVCDPANTAPFQLLFDRDVVQLAPGQTRPVKLSVEPDLCSNAALTFSSSDPTVVVAPTGVTLGLRTPFYGFGVTGLGQPDSGTPIATRTATLTATLKRADGSTAQASLPIQLMDATVPTCMTSDMAAGQISGSAVTLGGTGTLVNASLSAPPGAYARTDWLSLPAFPAQISCDADLSGKAPGAPVAIGPAVKFMASSPVVVTQSLRRELDFAVPVNPAAIPPSGRMRHLEVLYQGPTATIPRVITVANPRIELVPGGTAGVPSAYVLRFSSPWFGTYQAAFPPDAGTRHRVRHLTHRAVVGFSMGAGGAATFGMRHHDKFDLIAPLGGFSDWTWLGWYVENYKLGGFCPVSQPNCPTYAPDSYPLHETFAHTEDWNHFFYETGGGNGGSFSRGEQAQIFEDVALMMGNPDGQNADPELSFMAPGLTASDGFVHGDTTGLPPGIDCRVTVDPISGDPNESQQQQWQSQCNASRCDPKNVWVAATGFYNDEYNPDGSRQVISFCDGNQMGTSPYVDTWAPVTPATANPIDPALAVDLNRNGVRDQNEPIIRMGHERYQDTGLDGMFDAQEPNYDPLLNPDPNQDDYDFQLNPNGTENNHHYEMGEPFKDYGLDGVQGTKQVANGGYDYGEGDGVYTMADGVKNLQFYDGHSILHQWATALPSGPMTDDEILRISFWNDGGVRDISNFEAVANHLEGSVAARLAADGTQLKTTAFYNNFSSLPGEDPTMPDQFDPKLVRWADVVDAPSIRYGTVDATPTQIAQGDGQHVGTGSQLLYRLESSVYFAAQQWPDADRTVTELSKMNPESSTVNPLGIQCEIAGLCQTMFTGPKTGRTGPIVIQLPPGYALADNVKRNVRYPVVFVLHGYGMDPSGLQAVAVVSTNFMNDELRSAATRLAKFILVYVDGRCRISVDGRPECIRGTFWMDSNRPDGGHIDSWFDEVLDYLDQNYRTMPPSDVDVVE